MITTRLLPVYNDANGVGGFISGTVSGSLTPFSGNDNILRDGSDDSYVTIVGNPSTQEQSQGVSMIQPSDRDIGTTLSAVMPTNVTEMTVEFSARVRRDDTCASDSAFIECWIAGAGDELFVQDVPLSGAFTNVSIPIPSPPDLGPWDIHWFIAQVLFFGFRARTACPLLPDGEMGVQWSNASLTVVFALPTPVVTVVYIDDITPRSATFIGAVNPNQDNTSDATAYPLEWGFSFGTDPRNLPAVTYEGTVSGTTSAIRVVSEVTGLQPGTIYYCRLGARVDEVETLSAIATFTTPFTDPLKGVY